MNKEMYFVSYAICWIIALVVIVVVSLEQKTFSRMTLIISFLVNLLIGYILFNCMTSRVKKQAESAANLHNI